MFNALTPTAAVYLEPAEFYKAWALLTELVKKDVEKAAAVEAHMINLEVLDDADGDAAAAAPAADAAAADAAPPTRSTSNPPITPYL